MADVDEFLAAVVPPLTAADTAIHNGDAGQRIALWSRKDPVTLFGALQTKTGWGEIAPTFEMLASRFSNCESFEYEVSRQASAATSPTSPESSTPRQRWATPLPRRTRCASRPFSAARTASGKLCIGTPIRSQRASRRTRSWAA